MLPDGWIEISLAEHTIKIGSGVTPRGGQTVYKNSGIPLLRSQNVGWGKLLLKDVAHIDSDQHDLMAGSKVKNSDVLLNITGASIGRAAAYFGEDNSANVNQHVCIIRLKDTVDARFLLQFLISSKGQNQIDLFQAGGNRQGLNFENIASFKVSLPPVSEQTQIAEVLGSVDAAIEATKAVIDQTKTVKQGLLRTLLTRGIGHKKFKDSPLGEIPETWEVKTLGEISKGKAEYGANVSAIAYDPALPRYIRITDIDDDGNLIPSAAKSIMVSDGDPYLLSENDFLFARSGATVGKTYRHKMTNGVCAFAGYLIRFVFDKRQVLPSFVEEITRSEMYKGWIRDNLRAGAQPNINAQEYSSYIIALPPLSEQNQICEALRSFNHCHSLNSVKLDTLQTLKKGLMDDLLTGKVRVGVANEAAVSNVVLFPAQTTRTPIRNQSLLAAEITAQLYDLQKFGVTKREKIMDICDRHVGLNNRTGRRAGRREFGSYDEDARHAIDGIFESENWFKIRTETKNGHNIYKYGRGTNFRAHASEFDTEFGDVKADIQHIIDLLRDQDTRQCEIIDTLYTAWNDLIIDRIARNANDLDIPDDEIFKEVLDWHPSKGKISKTEWEWGMRWLRQKSLIPTGKGLSSKPVTLF